MATRAGLTRRWSGNSRLRLRLRRLKSRNECGIWYALVPRANLPHAETKASFHLDRQGFSIYCPRYLKQRRHARRVDKIAAPLFPGYVFVAIDLATQRWPAIDSTIGVARLVRNGDRPAAVPQLVIEALKLPGKISPDLFSLTVDRDLCRATRFALSVARLATVMAFMKA